MSTSLASPMPLHPLEQAAQSIRWELTRIYEALSVLEGVLPPWAEPYLLEHSAFSGLSIAVRCANDRDVASMFQALQSIDEDEVERCVLCQIGGSPFRLDATIAGVRFLCFVEAEVAS